MLNELTDADKRTEFQLQFYHKSECPSHSEMKIKEMAFQEAKIQMEDESFDFSEDSIFARFLIKRKCY